MSVYCTSPLKRIRRTRGQLDDLLGAAVAILAGEEDQITIRHLFYRLVTNKHLEKTERAYRLLCQHLAVWRRSGAIPWNSFADTSRTRYAVDHHSTAEQALRNAAECYRKNLWLNQPHYIEVWCEKDTIAGALSRAVSRFGIEVFSCHGFASLSSLYNAAATFSREQKRGRAPGVLYLGDHDPSGIAIDRKAQETMRDDFNVDVEFTRLAVTAEQIVELDLPTRPVKGSDSRAKDWIGECVEVDAIPMAHLRGLLEKAITSKINGHEWAMQEKIEELERTQLLNFVSNWEGATNGS